MTQRFAFSMALTLIVPAVWAGPAEAESPPQWIANRTATVRFIEHQALADRVARQRNRIGVTLRDSGLVDLERDRNEASVSSRHVNSLYTGPLEAWIKKPAGSARIDVRDGAVIVAYRNVSHDQVLRIESDGAGGCRASMSYVLRPGHQTFRMRSIKTKAPVEYTSLSASGISCTLENDAVF